MALHLRRLTLFALAFALFAAQALGLMHRVVHGPQAGGALAGVQAHSHAHPHEGGHAHDHVHGAGAGWAAALFAGHADDSSCRLFDPLSHEGLPGVAAPVLPLAFGSFFLDCLQGEFLARWVALFDARGPPALR